MGIISTALLRVSEFWDDMEAGGGNWVTDTIPQDREDIHTWALNDIIADPQNPNYGGSYAIGNRSLTDSPSVLLPGQTPPADWDYEPDTNSWVGLFSAIDLVGRFGTNLTFYVRHDLGGG